MGHLHLYLLELDPGWSFIMHPLSLEAEPHPPSVILLLHPGPRDVDLLEVHVCALGAQPPRRGLHAEQRLLDTPPPRHVNQHVVAGPHQVKPLAEDVLQVRVAGGGRGSKGSGRGGCARGRHGSTGSLHSVGHVGRDGRIRRAGRRARRRTGRRTRRRTRRRAGRRSDVEYVDDEALDSHASPRERGCDCMGTPSPAWNAGWVLCAGRCAREAVVHVTLAWDTILARTRRGCDSRQGQLEVSHPADIPLGSHREVRDNRTLAWVGKGHRWKTLS
mmetsp:Transcript_70858/g.191534  ORF Transcript_70858/g.191534 Transcript_70858/m.191534 type:complete len:274 (-) Transcript_70858:377-1198(-)